MSKAVLLVNLGTPRSPTPGDVGAYLREFLSDPRIVDLPGWLWKPLLYLVIVPLRKGRSAHAYQQIWTAEGSPLLVHSQGISDALGAALDGEAEVRLAMRYGQPDVAEELDSLRRAGVSDLTVLPLYPQFSGTTSCSVYDAVDRALEAMDWSPRLRRIQAYHDDPNWVRAVAESIRHYQAQNGRPDRLLFSLHGIPKRYVDEGDPYACQCEASVAAIADELGLAQGDYQLTYQSRVGREPWLQPYTDVTLKDLPRQGIRRVQVVCPGFAADCLETLEEIAIQNRELFIESGGRELEYIPALNDTPGHVAALAGIVRAAWREAPVSRWRCRYKCNPPCRFPEPPPC